MFFLPFFIVQALGFGSTAVAQNPDFEVTGGVLVAYHGAGGDVVIPGDLGITAIGDYAFAFNYTVTSVSIPEGVNSIGGWAFLGCPITSILIPASVDRINNGAFGGCSQLLTIDVAPGNANYTSLDGVLYNTDKTSLLCFPAGISNIGISIPSTVKTIADFAFQGSRVYSVDIPNSVETIGNSAFNNCALTSIFIPSSVTAIGNSAFVYSDHLSAIDVDASNPNYSSLDGVLYDKTQSTLYCYPTAKSSSVFTIPTSVTTIIHEAFAGCMSINSITIPSSVTAIDWYAFSYCRNLTSVIVNWTAPLSIDPVVFDGVNLSACALIVPAGTTADYQADPVWGLFGMIVEQAPVDGVTMDRTTASMTAGQTLQLTATVSPIGAVNKNVSWSSSNESVATVSSEGLVSGVGPGPATITATTDEGGFTASCALTVYATNPDYVVVNGVLIAYHGPGGDVVIPDNLGITAIGDYVFSMYNSITSITIPEGVTQISQTAFIGCVSCSTINVDANNPNYSSAAGVLYNKDQSTLCTYPRGKNDDSFTIPGSVTAILPYAFYNNNYLRSVVIPASVTSIGDYAFAYCWSIYDVYVSWTTPIDMVASPNTFIYYSGYPNCYLHVPAGTLSAYQQAPVWKDFANIAEPTAPTNIYLSFRTPIYILAGQTQQLQVTVYPRAASQMVDWSSDNPAIVSVSSSGLITANSLGAAILTVTSREDPNVSNSFAVNVVNSDFVVVNNVLVAYLGSDADVVIPDNLGITEIGSNAFQGKYFINTVCIPEGVTTIDNYAFMNCSNLTSVTIPGSLTTLGSYFVFDYCSKLITIDVDPTNAYFVSVDGALFSKDMTILYHYPGGRSATTYSIPNSVTTIFNDAFCCSYNLTSIVIPTSVTSIGTWAFESCSGLTTLSIPNSVGTISASAFSNCNNLADVTVYRTVPLDFPDYIFYNYNYIFTGNISNTTLHVPVGTKSLYQNAVIWKDFGTIVDDVVLVTGASLNPTTAALNVGATRQLTATIAPTDGTYLSIAWSSSNPAVATVSANGLITGLSSGTAVITFNVATNYGDFTATCNVTVSALSSDALLSALTISQGTLTPTFDPSIIQYTAEVAADVSTLILYADTRDPRATLDGIGTMSVSVGENVFNIIVLAEDGSKKVYTVIINRAAPAVIAATGISLDKTDVSIFIDETEQLTATVSPSNVTDLNVIWTSSDETVATVDFNGLITGIGTGTATITVTTVDGGYTANCTVTVSSPTGIPTLHGEIGAYLYKGRLYVNSPVAETIRVYSVSGVLLHHFHKLAGAVDYPVNCAPNSVLLVKGSSGWVIKGLMN